MFITAITDVQDSTGTTLIVPDQNGRPALTLKLGAGLTGSYSKNGDQGVVLVTARPNGTAMDLTLGATGTGAAGALCSVFTVQPSLDFPGTTKATLYAEMWADWTGGASAWAASTSYSSTSSPPSIVNVSTGQASNNALFVCTTSGTSSGTHGPQWNGTPPSTGLQDQGGSACRWRAALANLIVSVNGSPVATLSTPYTLAGAAAAPSGYANVRVTADLSSALMGLSSVADVSLTIAGDASDTGSVSRGILGRARLIFT